MHNVHRVYSRSPQVEPRLQRPGGGQLSACPTTPRNALTLIGLRQVITIHPKGVSLSSVGEDPFRVWSAVSSISLYVYNLMRVKKKSKLWQMQKNRLLGIGVRVVKKTLMWLSNIVSAISQFRCVGTLKFWCSPPNCKLETWGFSLVHLLVHFVMGKNNNHYYFLFNWVYWDESLSISWSYCLKGNHHWKNNRIHAPMIDLEIYILLRVYNLWQQIS